MGHKDKEILLKDLCARLSYGVKVEIISYGQETLKPWFGELSCKDLDCFIHDIAYESIKPYLRPMSSMTEEDNLSLSKCVGCSIRVKYGEIYFPNIEDNTLDKWEKVFDWLNAHHFDYRGLIERDLALEAPKNWKGNDL